MEADGGSAHLSLSPTFSSYSSGSSNLAEIAARVVSEIGEELLADSDNNYGQGRESAGSESGARGDDVGGNGDEDDEFEFAVLCREPDASTISANEIFHNGQIKPFYPLFNMDLLLDNVSRVDTGLENFKKKPPVRRRSPLGNLMNKERRQATSFSSSEANGLGTVPSSETYCAWSPSTEKTSPGRCNKRNSTGSSNRWKLRDLLHNYSRGKSEGQDALVTKTNTKKGDQPVNASKGKEGSKSGTGGVASSTHSSSGLPSFLSQNARFWKNRAMKAADKRMSHLPYRQHAVGCVGDANATTKNLHPI